MAKFARLELQSWRCREGQHDTVIETMDGHKRCGHCGFPMTPEAAVNDVTEQLRRIGVMPPDQGR